MSRLCYFITSILSSVLLSSCLSLPGQNNDGQRLFESPGYTFPYRLSQPEQDWELPSSLVEISGISIFDDHHLACIQDENGIIYLFNTETGKIEKEIPFGDDGDYEDIVVLGEDAWVLKSDGTLYAVNGFQAVSTTTAVKHRTPLSELNDTEGLAWDPAGKAFLIACKESPYADGASNDAYRAVYAYDPEAGRMGIEPALLLSLETVRAHMEKAGIAPAATAGPKAKPGKTKTFKPSGIAVHPATGDLYLLGSAGKLLIVADREAAVKAIVCLDPGQFRQPEGICFSPEGTLFISSEGDGAAAKISRFEPKP